MSEFWSRVLTWMLFCYLIFQASISNREVERRMPLTICGVLIRAAPPSGTKSRSFKKNIESILSLWWPFVWSVQYFHQYLCISLAFFLFFTGLESLSVNFRDPNPTRPPVVRIRSVLYEYGIIHNFFRLNFSGLTPFYHSGSNIAAFQLLLSVCLLLLQPPETHQLIVLPGSRFFSVNDINAMSWSKMVLFCLNVGGWMLCTR